MSHAMTAHLSRVRFFVCCFFSVCLSAGLLASLFVLCQFVDVIWFNSFVCHKHPSFQFFRTVSLLFIPEFCVSIRQFLSNCLHLNIWKEKRKNDSCLTCLMLIVHIVWYYRCQFVTILHSKYLFAGVQWRQWSTRVLAYDLIINEVFYGF